jgi:hypothetical protein
MYITFDEDVIAFKTNDKNSTLCHTFVSEHAVYLELIKKYKKLKKIDSVQFSHEFSNYGFDEVMIDNICCYDDICSCKNILASLCCKIVTNMQLYLKNNKKIIMSTEVHTTNNDIKIAGKILSKLKTRKLFIFVGYYKYEHLLRCDSLRSLTICAIKDEIYLNNASNLLSNIYMFRKNYNVAQSFRYLTNGIKLFYCHLKKIKNIYLPNSVKYISIFDGKVYFTLKLEYVLFINPSH